MDATKRVLLVKRTPSGDDYFVCAEPSPDALMAVAGQLAASGGVGDQASAQAAASFGEAAASIGFRNASIQLMRDFLYRACEAVMNGVVDAIDPTTGQRLVDADGRAIINQEVVATVITRLDEIAVAIEGINALGGLGPVPLVAIGTNASTSTAKPDDTKTEGGTVSIEFSAATTRETSDIAPVAEQIYKIVELFFESGKSGGPLRETP